MIGRRVNLAAPAGVALLVGITAFGLVACDTGDGKTLRNTVTPTTEPPPATEPLESVAIDENGVVGETAPPTSDDSDPETFTAVAPWVDGAPIDAIYTCEGDNISPAISWHGLPLGTAELAIVVTDDDAVTDGAPFVHWVVAGIAPEDISLIEGSVPQGAIEGVNSFGEVGWGGPCPPQGDGAHTYRFTVHALAQQVELANATPADVLIDFISDVTFARAEVTGTFER